MLLQNDSTGCDELRHLDQGAVNMKLRKKFLSALAGLSLSGIPLGSMAAVLFNLPSTRIEPSWQSSRQHSPMIFAQEDDQYEWHHHHHHQDLDPNDYNWGGRNRYQYAPGWFSSPPAGWAMDRRRACLKQRRQVGSICSSKCWRAAIRRPPNAWAQSSANLTASSVIGSCSASPGALPGSSR